MKTIEKRSAALLLAAAICLCLAACGSNPIPEAYRAEHAAAVDTAPAAVQTAAPEPESAPEADVAAAAYDTAAYEAAVNALLDEYRVLRITEPGEFREEEHPEIPWYTISSYQYVQFDEQYLYCGRYDFDGNGVPELVIAMGDDSYRQPIGVYAFDGAALRYLCKELPLGERSTVGLAGDGVFTVHASGGASVGSVVDYRIADDGFSTEILDWYDYEYQADGSVHVTVKAGGAAAENADPAQAVRDFDVPIDYTRLD
ncbi:MAG: hypothetical protein IJ594_03000 [Oscillospiraceae bacterium]|nr:hypothetical protein [Oscillospiraceae bacterium]